MRWTIAKSKMPDVALRVLWFFAFAGYVPAKKRGRWPFILKNITLIGILWYMLSTIWAWQDSGVASLQLTGMVVSVLKSAVCESWNMLVCAGLHLPPCATKKERCKYASHNWGVLLKSLTVWCKTASFVKWRAFICWLKKGNILKHK